MYNPALEKRLFTREAPPMHASKAALDEAEAINKDLLFSTSNNLRFQKFEPRGENQDVNSGLNFNDDF